MKPRAKFEKSGELEWMCVVRGNSKNFIANHRAAESWRDHYLDRADISFKETETYFIMIIKFIDPADEAEFIMKYSK